MLLRGTIAMKRKTAKFALALLFSASTGTIAVTAPAVAMAQDDNFTRYAQSGYNYCDAKMMGAIYGEDAYQGKLLIGQKIANGIGSNIPFMLNQSRSQGNSCGWQDLPYTYADAEKLGNYWGVDTYEAKLKAARFYTNGEAGVVESALGGGIPDHASEDFEQDAIEAFGRSGFTYCDAKIIGALWGNDPLDGKITIGSKIINGLISDIPYFLDQSRDQGNWCEWSDTIYVYEDAQRLSQMWNMDVASAKLAVAKLVSRGRSDVVNGSLGR